MGEREGAFDADGEELTTVDIVRLATLDAGQEEVLVQGDLSLLSQAGLSRTAS
jgi:hypothetical protein